jgi:isoleucyl-tRNA synthetase
LPGNIALAVGPDIEYVKVRVNDEQYILAKNRVEAVFKDISHEVLETIKGKALLGKAYKPLYPFAQEIAPESEKPKFENAYKVHAADFVTTIDGTGIVHTAVMYGQDDFELGQKIGLPKVHLVAPDGRFVAGTGILEGKSVIDADTNVEILKDLQTKKAVFSKESYTHSYPHCWRSKNRLIYYARDSWFIRMHDLRETLVKENRKIHWEPDYIQGRPYGRMARRREGVGDITRAVLGYAASCMGERRLERTARHRFCRRAQSTREEKREQVLRDASRRSAEQCRRISWTPRTSVPGR